MSDLVLKAALDIEMFGHLTRGTLSTLEASLGWDDCLIYSILHEPIYTNGTAPRWSAHRVKEDEYPEFSLKRLDSDDPLYFTGEMVYPWMFDDCFELAKVKPVAEKLAADSNWPPLYDLEQLAKNEVPVYAAAYVEDMVRSFLSRNATYDADLLFSTSTLTSLERQQLPSRDVRCSQPTSTTTTPFARNARKWSTSCSPCETMSSTR